MSAHRVQIRFNTKYQEAPDADLKWRVLIDGEEYLASKVTFLVPSETSQDIVEGGITKWHLSSVGPCDVRWSGTEVTIA